MAIGAEAVQDDYRRLERQIDGPYDPRWHLTDSPLACFIFHDLRLPLTAILAYSELLGKDDLEGSVRRDFCREIRFAVTRMNDLISLLLMFSKGCKIFHPQAADIRSTIERGIQVVAIRPEFRRIAIRYDHEGFAEGHFDPGRLEQVVSNIILNACEAVSPAKGKVDVTSLGRRHCLEISISDNGPGMPESVRHALFQPFMSHGKEGGTGLGLAIVRELLRIQGGDIYLGSTSKEGTVFRLQLPFHGPPEAATHPF